MKSTHLLNFVVILISSFAFAAGKTVKSNPTQISVLAMSTNTPSWRASMAVGDFKEIPSSSMSLLIPTVSAPGNGRANIIDAWNGLAIDPKSSTIYSLANGGHSDWAGNEVNAIRMTDDNPKWIEKRPSSPVNKIVESQNYYLDGQPTSRHSYYGVVFNQNRNRVLLMTGYYWAGNANMIPTMDGYSPQANVYDPAGTFGNVPSALSNGPGAPFIEDPATDDIYSFAGYGIYKWSNATGKWSNLLDNTPVYGYAAAAAFDSKRKQLLECSGIRSPGTSICYLYDIATNKLTPMAFPNTGLSDSLLDSSGGDLHRARDPIRRSD